MDYAMIEHRRDQAREGYRTGLKGLVSVAVVALVTVAGAKYEAILAIGTIYCSAIGLGSAAVFVVDGLKWGVAVKQLKAAGRERLPEARLLR